MKMLCWIFWHVVYAVRPRPKEPAAYLVRADRLRSPWWKFKPTVYYNPDGRMWHVYLDNESSHTRPSRGLFIELHIGQESGKVVGLNIWDESLRAVADASGGEQ